MGRLGFILITLFWVTMNLLLWRAEYGQSGGGSQVPVDVVLGKLLTSPDPSTLEIRYQGEVVGFAHWYPDPGEESEQMFSEAYIPEGMVRSERSLLVRFDANFSLPVPGTRLRLDASLSLAPDRTWQVLDLQVATRELQVVLRVDEPEQQLEWRVQGPGLRLSNTLDLHDARDPRKLLNGVGEPLESLLAGPWGGAVPHRLDLGSGLQTEARLDWLPVGTSRVRIYRLRARWLDRYEAVLLINRAGEVLRLELPGGWRITNQGLTGL
jgi:hypothetical protein